MRLPRQKTTIAQKFAKDRVTGRCDIYDTIDYYISRASYSNNTNELITLRDAVHGVLYDKDYKNVTNPYNMKTGADGTTPTFNAKLRNHNILKGIVNLLIGEFGRRSHEYEVIDFNVDDESIYKDKLTEVVKGYYQQQIINTLNELGFPTNQDSKELPELQQYIDSFKSSYEENRILAGQDALDYIKFNQDLEDKYITAYWDWIVYGRIYTYKAVLNDEVICELVPAYELYVPFESKFKYVENRSFAVRKSTVPLAWLLDTFRKDLNEKDLQEFDSEYAGYAGLETFTFTIPVNNGGLIKMPSVYLNESTPYSDSVMNNSGVLLYHVQFKTWVPVGILTYTNELGQTTIKEVDETYKLQPELGDINIEWEWENQIFQAWKYRDKYLRVEPLLENRSELNNSSIQKLCYNGIEERSPDGGVQSIIKQGLDYQRLINVLHYQTEKIFNKNKDKLVVMPFGMIPTKKGMTAKEVMYHADATSILWIDETAPNAAYASQMIKVLDMNLMGYAKEVLSVIDYIKGEFWDEIGMNRQRYADVTQSAGKGTTEQAIIRSSIITAELTRQFDKFIEKDYEGFLDLSKLAWVNGKKGKYIRSDGAVAFLTLNQDDAKWHTERSYGVFVKNAFTNTEARDALRALGQPLVQNGAPLSSIAKLYSTDSVAKLTHIVGKIEELNRKYAQEIKDADAQHQQDLQKMVNENDAQNRDMEKYKIDKGYDGIVYTADARSESNKRDTPQPARESNEVETMLANHKIEDDIEKRKQKDKELAIKEKLSNKPKNN